LACEDLQALRTALSTTRIGLRLPCPLVVIHTVYKPVDSINEGFPDAISSLFISGSRVI
jgi:hypothetical protein